MPRPHHPSHDARLPHPTREALLAILRSGDAASADLMRAIGLSETGTRHHLEVLMGAGLVRTWKRGRVRWYGRPLKGGLR